MFEKWKMAMLTPHAHSYNVHGSSILKMIVCVFGTDQSMNSKRNVRLVMKSANHMSHL